MARFESYIDSQDVTGYVLEGSLVRKLNRPAQATIRMPIQYAIGGPGSRLKIYIDGVLSFHGFILTLSEEGGEDAGYSEYVAQDPMELWRWRYARDEDGDLSEPDFMRNKKYGPAIMKYILENSEDTCGRPIDEPPCDGDLFIEYGFFEPGGSNLSGAPVAFPMTIAEVTAMLTSTGTLDVVLHPIEGGSNMAQVECVNGDYGQHLENSVHFQYAMGDYNVREMRQVYDLTSLCNKLHYYLGPKWDNQHWEANITGEDPFNDYWEICDGGATSFLAALGRVIAEQGFSQLRYGTRHHLQFYDSRGDESGLGMCIYRHLWLTEQLIRMWPRHLVHIEPIRGFDPNAFGIGDIVRVSAGGFMRNMLGIEQGVPVDQYGDMVPGGWTGTMRIFEYTVQWDTDGVPTITDIVTSPTDYDI